MNPFVDLTTGEAVRLIAECYRDKEALVFRDRRYSFQQVADEINRASARLTALGIGRGDKVSIWLPNCPEFLWCLFGAAQIGAVAVVLNTKLRVEEVAYQIDQSDSVCLVTTGKASFRNFIDDVAGLAPQACSARHDDKATTQLPKLKAVVSIDERPARFEKVRCWDELSRSDGFAVEDDPDAAALIAYTSGTTALPKGVVLTHCIWRKGLDAGATMGVTEEDRLYLCVPLFGMMGLITNGPLSWWTHGATVVLEERYELDTFFQTVSRERCTVIQLMPAVMAPIMQDRRFATLDRSRWRLATVLSSHPDTLRATVEKMGFRQVVCGYGMTESAAIVSRTRFDEPLDVQVASNGRPLPDVSVRIVDPETLQAKPPGGLGEIWLKGYFVMKEYYRKPEETAQAITADGWLRTGDLGVVDEQGYLQLKGRIKDSYKSRGFNVSALEVENAIRGHPAVGDAAVVGVPDQVHGEAGIAFVIVRENGSVGESEILEFCRERLATFKVPVRVIFVAEFPLTGGTEKVQKFLLRQMAMAGS